MGASFAYIDESGDPVISEGATGTFLICATIILEQDIAKVAEGMNELAIKYKLNELKSSSIRNESHRLAILEIVAQLPFKFVTIYVDKKRLVGDWFKYKGSFYMYVMKLLHHEVYQLFPNIEVHLDQYGSEAFRTSLVKYLHASLQLDLFESQVSIDSAKQNSLIQISDFIGGTVRKLFEKTISNDETFYGLLDTKWISRINLPTSKILEPIPGSSGNAIFDDCVREVHRYLQAHSDERSSKIVALEYLYYSAINDDRDYVYTAEILDWLKTCGYELTDEQFRNEVTGPLRDDGLLIVGTRKGYKIPQDEQDIREYLQFSLGLAIPVLKRVKKAISFLSAREIDVSRHIPEGTLYLLDKLEP